MAISNFQESQKITVTIPKSLLEQLNSLIPSRQRSSFITKAIQEQIAVLEQLEAVEESAGVWSDETYPELIDNEAIDEWLAQLRATWQYTDTAIH